MSIRWGPEPKLARICGAYTAARRAPNWLCSAGVATITSTPSGSGADGCTTDSLLAETLAASSAWHISGSQPISTLGRICCAIQAAAWLRFAAAICRALGVPGAGLVGCTDDGFCAWSPSWVKASVTSAPTAIAVTALSTRTPRWRREVGRWPRRVCLCSHRRNVVAATVAQDGSPLVPDVRLSCCWPISAPPQPRWLAGLLPKLSDHLCPGDSSNTITYCSLCREVRNPQHARPRCAFRPI